MTESAIQTQICNFLRGSNYFFFKIANEVKARAGIKGFGYWHKMKAEGLRAGVPDICVLLPQGVSIWLEVKRPLELKISEKTGKRIIARAQGRLSTEQAEWHLRARRLGHYVYVVRSVQETADIIARFHRFRG